MFWLGKFLGGIFGYLVGGPLGAVLGILVGHYFDISLKGIGLVFTPPKQEQSQLQEIFLRATFIIMGYVAKADGRVSENEIRLASRIMQNMRLSPLYKQRAIDYFRLGKLGNFNIDQLLSSLSNTYFNQRSTLHHFVNIQLQAAYADGLPSKKKEKILEYLCFKLNLNPRDFFQSTYHYEHFNQRNYQNSGYKQHYQAPNQPDPLVKAYSTLGVTKTTNNNDLKKAYRKLMSQHHPDKLMSKGLSEEKLRAATQKTQEIKQAYELICKSRGI